jgi:hypothetical protein
VNSSGNCLTKRGNAEGGGNGVGGSVGGYGERAKGTGVDSSGM